MWGGGDGMHTIPPLHDISDTSTVMKKTCFSTVCMCPVHVQCRNFVRSIHVQCRWNFFVCMWASS